MAVKLGERASSQREKDKPTPTAREVLGKYGVMARLELVHVPGGASYGAIVDLAAQNVSDYTGLNLTYDVRFGDKRTVNPGDPNLYAGYLPRTLREVAEELSTAFDFRLTFPLGTDPEKAKTAVQEIVNNEKVPMVLRIDERIKPK